jgi:16S rRNA (guanine527-N7)-methyltransferase
MRVVRGKVEEASHLAGAFTAAVARATFAPAAWIPIASRLVAPGGKVWVLLARESPPECEGWEIEIDDRYTWPLTGVERRALRYRQCARP